MSADEIVRKMRLAAAALGGVYGASVTVCLGLGECETVRAIAGLLSVPLERFVIGPERPLVIESVAVSIDGVEVRCQSSRTATRADASMPGFVAGASTTLARADFLDGTFPEVANG